jgi:hypothetical protein
VLYGRSMALLARRSEGTGRLCRAAGQELFEGTADVSNKKSFICSFLFAVRNLPFVYGFLTLAQAFENLSFLASAPVGAELLEAVTFRFLQLGLQPPADTRRSSIA